MCMYCYFTVHFSPIMKPSLYLLVSSVNNRLTIKLIKKIMVDKRIGDMFSWPQ